jgi:hypothetical protein
VEASCVVAVIELFILADFLWIRLAPPWPAMNSYSDYLPVYYITFLSPLFAFFISFGILPSRITHVLIVFVSLLVVSFIAVAVYLVLSSFFVHCVDGDRFQKVIVGKLTPEGQNYFQDFPSRSMNDALRQLEYHELFTRDSVIWRGVGLLGSWCLFFVCLGGVARAVLLLRREGTGRPAPPPTRGLFISYRRADSASVTGRICDRLVQHFGPDKVGIDWHSIPGGVEFPKRLQEMIRGSDVVLAVIGSQWLDVVDENGCRRLDNEQDLVRAELELALDEKIPLVPVLVEGALMPKKERLPPSLRGLANWNALPVRDGHDFPRDIERLIDCIEGVIRTRG